MLISQKQAIKRLRAETGLSFATCTRTAKRLAIHKDGERFKVNSVTLDIEIALLNRPVVEQPPRRNNVTKPLSHRTAAALRLV